MPPKNTWTRKEFLRASLLGGTVALIGGRARGAAPATTAAAPAVARTRSANEEVRIAIVGLNGIGGYHIDHFAKVAGVKMAVLCDCDQHVLARRAAEVERRVGYKPETIIDYRKVLDRPDIDAVVIATPNHWHSLMTIWACQAGKDVYVEKPVSHNIWEGRQALEAARKYNRIVQVGTQNRSATELQEAHAFIHSGKLGRVLWARGLCYNRRDSLGHVPGPQPVPAWIDYDLWSGPAPLVPPRRNTHNGPIHYDWHWFWNYGGGDISNQGVHQMDICRWFLDEPDLPPTAMSLGGRLGYHDDGQTPNTQIAVFGYKKAPLIFEVRGLPMRPGVRAMDAYRGARVGVVVQCEDGYFAPGETGGGAVYDNRGKKIARFIGPGGWHHQQNFIDAVRSRDSSILAAPLREGHISSSLSHLAGISYRLGQEKRNEAIRAALAGDAQASDSFARLEQHLAANRIDDAQTPLALGPTLHIVPGAERFVTAENYDVGYWANTMLRDAYRPPYVVPEVV